MLPSKREEGVILRCTKCGYEMKPQEGATVLRRNISHSPREREIVVIEKKESRLPLPTIRAFCPKCGNNTAYWWMIQTRAGDEPPTRFFRCTKCGYTWREYD